MLDVQNQKDERNIAIQRVGIKDIEVPLIIQRKLKNGKIDSQTVYAKGKMSTNLPEEFKGVHMSRFMEVVEDYRRKNLIGVDIKKMLVDIAGKMQAESAYLKFDFKYFIKKFAPVSNLSSLMCYKCYFEGMLEGEKYTFNLGVQVPVTTLCPCSKEISKYGAHNQRALVKVKVSYDDTEHIWIEDLIEEIEKCGSAEIYSLLKREDEKFVTEQAYENPRFVEDILREVVLKLEANKIIKNYEIEVEAHESIHNHSAWAYQSTKK
ncbi:GTP cyclohydrolase I FolE2 [bacterium]|nr:GTP cyclohydrolase I FolE2 [bacterium]